MQALRSADRELARRCVAGEQAAQRAFFEAHKRRVHHVLFRVLGTNRDIDDVIQDAFLAIFRSLPGYRGEAQLATWIDRICVRVAIRAIASRPRDRGPALELVPLAEDAGRGPDRRAEAREAARRLYALLDEIEPTHRAAFALHAIDGRELREVAAVMGASLIATKLRVWRTRQRIEAAARKDPALAPFVGAGPRTGAQDGRSAHDEGGEP